MKSIIAGLLLLVFITPSLQHFGTDAASFQYFFFFFRLVMAYFIQ